MWDFDSGDYKDLVKNKDKKEKESKKGGPAQTAAAGDMAMFDLGEEEF